MVRTGAAELLLLLRLLMGHSWPPLPPPRPGCCVLFAVMDDEAPRAWRLLDRDATAVVWTAAAGRVLAGSAARDFGVGAGEADGDISVSGAGGGGADGDEDVLECSAPLVAGRAATPLLICLLPLVSAEYELFTLLPLPPPPPPAKTGGGGRGRPGA